METTKVILHDATETPDIAALVAAADAAMGIGLLADLTITGSNGDDEIDGSRDAEHILGLGGDDEIRGRGGDDVIEGGAGDDELRGDSGSDEVYGGADDDRVRGGSGNDTVDGGDGDDRVRGDGWDDVVYGGDGDDRVEGKWGNDTVYGGNGDDRVKGGDGDDIVHGGAGDDDVWGNLGNDVLVFAPGGGRDKIHDFNHADDVVDLTAYGLTDIDALLASIVQINLNDSALSLPGGDRIVFDNALPGDFEADDFLLM